MMIVEMMLNSRITVTIPDLDQWQVHHDLLTGLDGVDVRKGL
jgi:hypothetical protein